MEEQNQLIFGTWKSRRKHQFAIHGENNTSVVQIVHIEVVGKWVRFNLHQYYVGSRPNSMLPQGSLNENVSAA